APRLPTPLRAAAARLPRPPRRRPRRAGRRLPALPHLDRRDRRARGEGAPPARALAHRVRAAGDHLGRRAAGGAGPGAEAPALQAVDHERHRHARARGPGRARALGRRPAPGERRAHGAGTPAGAQGRGRPPPLRARPHRRAHRGRTPADGGLAPARGRRGEERRMRLATFTHGGTTRTGVVMGDEVVDLGPSDMAAFVAAGLERAAEAAAKARARLPLHSVRLEAPVLRPPKFLAVGLNYADHVAESGAERPALPTFSTSSRRASRARTTRSTGRASRSSSTTRASWASWTGRRCRHVPRARAAEAIAGWVVLNDVSVRDWQLRVPTWQMRKSLETR